MAKRTKKTVTQKRTSKEILKLTETIREMVKVSKKDIKKVLQALTDVQVDQWLAEKKVYCAPVGYVYVKEIHKDYIIDRETREHIPGERTIYKMRTKRSISASDKWAEQNKGYYHDVYSR